MNQQVLALCSPKLRLFLREHWRMVTACITFAGIAIWFGFTFLADAIYFNDPDHKDDELQGWMTPKYVQLSYELPRSLVLETLGLPEKLDRMIRMKDIAADQKVTLKTLTERVRDAAVQYRQSGSQEDSNDD